MAELSGAFGMSGLMDSTTRILSQALDGLTSRQSVISANLSNIDTPNYQPKAVDFETALQSEVAAMRSAFGSGLPPADGPAADVAMKTTDPRHFSTIASLSGDASAAVATVNENIRNDNNKVDLETEMTALTQTQIKYSADSRLLTSKFSQLYNVIGGR
jgi:flagellar basal-body rod protein FlgB